MKSYPKFKEVNPKDLAIIVERTRSALSADDHTTLKAAVDTLEFLATELQSKRTTVERLRKWLFGASTEKTKNVLEKCGEEGDAATAPSDTNTSDKPKERPKRPGHGRNAAADLKGAGKVKVPHPSLHKGDLCRDCERGRLQLMAEPALFTRFVGMAPINATVYEKERLRCNLCGEVTTAPTPEGVGDKKYDETATATIGLLKYGAGMPFFRLQKFQRGMGILLPAATQWDLVRNGAKLLTVPFKELIRQAAQGDVLHNDDTKMKILTLTAADRAKAAAVNANEERTGVFTTGIVSTKEGRLIGLYFTGPKHAGENIADLLTLRPPELSTPIQMCDALSHNTKGDFETILANCLAHARRKFVDVVHHFPEECRFVIETLRDVYKNDALAKHFTKDERLRFHQQESGPLMDKLKEWLAAQIAEHKVEKNSGLGQAIQYMTDHWLKLTLFLRVPGAPLDNNICERVLKKAILHRKNALFYKTLNGARVGDTFMSLIHTAELNGGDPYNYLVALLRHHKIVKGSPANWMPWNYQDTLANLVSAVAQAA